MADSVVTNPAALQGYEIWEAGRFTMLSCDPLLSWLATTTEETQNKIGE